MSPQGEFVLAIDLGTSGPKVGLVSLSGEVVATDFEPTRLLLFPGGGAEQAPDEWWQAIKKASQRLLAKGHVPPEAIVAVNCTSLYSTTVAVDRKGRPLMNAIFWMDTRGAPYVRRVTGGPISFEGYGITKVLTWLRKTGGAPTHSGKDSLAHILYLKHEHPEIYDRTYKFLEPKDYVNLLLTGEFAATYDSINLHWLTDNRDIAHIDYDDRLLSLAGVEREKFPALRRAVDVLGTLRPEVADELGLPHGIPVIAGSTDAQSAAVGAGAVQDFQTYLYLGTSSWISCHVPFKKTDLRHNMASLPSAIPGRYYVANEQECAGVCLTYLRDNLFFPQDELQTDAPPDNCYSTFDRVAERTPAGSGRVLFTPWLYGERTPVEDPWLRGGFFNLSLKTGRGQRVRAVFEGVAYNARWLHECVERFCGRNLEPIRMIGGGAQSNVWCQIHADVLNRTVWQLKDPLRANLRGAAFMAAVALGHLSFEDIPARIQVERVYQPNPYHRRLYDELFGEFLTLYRRNKDIYARLNRV